MRQKMRNNRGFTLVELILAIALMGIISVFLLAGITFAMRTLFASGDYMEQNYTVQAELDDFVGTDDSAAKVSQSLTFTWIGSPGIPDFTVTGDHVSQSTHSLALDETFYAFVPTSITPKN